MTTELIQLTNQTKPVVVARVTIAVPIAGSETSATPVEVPRPSCKTREEPDVGPNVICGGGLLIVIVAALINIAMHVVQPKRVRLFGSNLVSMLLINIPSVFSIPSVIIECLCHNTDKRLSSIEVGFYTIENDESPPGIIHGIRSLFAITLVMMPFKAMT